MTTSKETESLAAARVSKMELSITGRAEVTFEVTPGVHLSLHKRYTSAKEGCERYMLSVKVEGPSNAPGEAIQGDAHAMLRHSIHQAADALLRALDEDESAPCRTCAGVGKHNCPTHGAYA